MSEIEQPVEYISAPGVEDVEPVSFHQDWEYSHPLVTNRKDACVSFSFRITTYEPNFERVVRADGVHEVVLHCLEGESRQILDDGREIHFTPATATYLPRVYQYRHIVRPQGLKVAVACNPPRE